MWGEVVLVGDFLLLWEAAGRMASARGRAGEVMGICSIAAAVVEFSHHGRKKRRGVGV